MGLLPAIAQTWPPAGVNGDGLSEATAWELSTPVHLEALAISVNNGSLPTQNKYFKLMDDIDLSSYADEEGWVPIGISSNRFKGNFNGNGKVIYNLTINNPTQDYMGLFGWVTGATIKNLGIVDCNITGKLDVGGLIGVNAVSTPATTIDSCYAIGIVSGESSVGVLIGISENINISHCFTEGEVNGTKYLALWVMDLLQM